jgi:hypothetical protein
MMGLLGNVAEVPELRSQLMTSAFVNEFSMLLGSTSDGIEVSYWLLKVTRKSRETKDLKRTWKGLEKDLKRTWKGLEKDLKRTWKGLEKDLKRTWKGSEKDLKTEQKTDLKRTINYIQMT